MAKPRSTPALHDQSTSYGSKLKPQNNPRPIVAPQGGSGRFPDRVSYIPGEVPREEPKELPRLFVRGLGGSIKMDLSGLGIDLPPEAFAFTMPDESLRHLQIHDGDIAIIQPLESPLRSGNLLLVHIGEHETLRQVVELRGVWYVEAGDDAESNLLLLADQAIEGIVRGVLRLFEKVKPVRYRTPETNFARPREKQTLAAIPKHRNKCRKKSSPTKMRYRAPQRERIGLAAEQRKPHRLSEIEES